MNDKSAVYIGSEVYRRSSFGQNHPLAYSRQESVVDVCRLMGWISDDMFMNSPVANSATLARFHDKDYISAIRKSDIDQKVSVSARKKFNIGNFENPIFNGVYERAATTVGGSILAAKLAMIGRVAFHPSGGTHHGQKDKASGFCYFNDPVFSILTLLDAGLKRVLYVDIDAHHGDGVEKAFAEDSRVTTLSIHEDKRWPHSGGIDQQAVGTINIPVPHGLNDSEFECILDNVVLPYCHEYCPQAIVITCGADGLKDDPLSKMNLSNVALWKAVLQLRDLSPACVVLGGGGYNPWTTIRCWAGLWAKLSGFEIPDELPKKVKMILEGFDSDLIDEEDRDPRWMTSISDQPNKGPVRQEIVTLAAHLSAQLIAESKRAANF